MILDEVDHLYEQAVCEPESLNDQAIADWADSVASNYELDRQGAKHVRRCLNAGRKLVAFWSARQSTSQPEDWRTRVDMALGARAWRPQLELAMHHLETSPDPEAFERATELFRIVHNEPFLDGLSYEEWCDQRHN